MIDGFSSKARKKTFRLSFAAKLTLIAIGIDSLSGGTALSDQPDVDQKTGSDRP